MTKTKEEYTIRVSIDSDILEVLDDFGYTRRFNLNQYGQEIDELREDLADHLMDVVRSYADEIIEFVE